jgi:hypothetical protein
MADLVDLALMAAGYYALIAGGLLLLAGIGMALAALEERFTRSGHDTWDSPLDDLAPRTSEDTVKRRSVKADEYDTVTYWRRYLCYLARPGATDRIKRRMRRRERHDARHRLRRGDEQ